MPPTTFIKHKQGSTKKWVSQKTHNEKPKTIERVKRVVSKDAQQLED